jgi:hypothetical protein
VCRNPNATAKAYVNDDDVNRYLRHGSVAIDRWSPPEDSGEIDYAIDWKAI